VEEEAKTAAELEEMILQRLVIGGIFRIGTARCIARLAPDCESHIVSYPMKPFRKKHPLLMVVLCFAFIERLWRGRT